MKATQQLKDEHEGIKLMLMILEKICWNINNDKRLNFDHIDKVVDFIKGFADKCHHGKEEEILFPAMIKSGIPKEGGPISVMLHEHEIGRNHIKALSKAIDEVKSGNNEAAATLVLSAGNYIELLRNHIEKENNILFKMADQVLNEEEQSKIFDEFEKLEVEKIGIGKHEEYH